VGKLRHVLCGSHIAALFNEEIIVEPMHKLLGLSRNHEKRGLFEVVLADRKPVVSGDILGLKKNREISLHNRGCQGQIVLSS
jgi:hypothetical protein